MTDSSNALRAVRTLHTVVWAFFAGSVIGIPVMVWRDQLGVAWILITIVLVEVAILAVNHWRCPLTAIAARYTRDRQDNFDIYLPLWLARYNKIIFGTLYASGLIYTLASWRGWVD